MNEHAKVIDGKKTESSFRTERTKDQQKLYVYTNMFVCRRYGIFVSDGVFPRDDSNVIGHKRRNNAFKNCGIASDDVHVVQDCFVKLIYS